MAFFFFDESIHPDAGFALGAFVCFEDDPTELIASCLTRAGLRPAVDEYKSGARMDRYPAQARAREELRGAVERCKIGVVVTPAAHRADMGRQALSGLKKFVDANQLTGEHHVFLDEGLVPNRAAAESLADGFGLRSCVLHVEQDSVVVLGIQVADLVAHTCSTMLKAQMGLVTKQVKAGENSGYDPNDDMDLSFMLWAGLRWQFFAAPPVPPEQWKDEFDWQVDVESRGLFVAESCGTVLREAALERFGRMYLGCIH